MLDHGADEFIVGPLRIVQAQLAVGRSLDAQQAARGHTHAGDQSVQGGAVRWRLQVLDDDGLNAALAKHRQYVARSAAVGVVVDREFAHVASCGEDIFDHAYCLPMSRTWFCKDMLSRLRRGRDRNSSIRRRKTRAVSAKARCFSTSLPSTAAGSGTPQWAVTGCPGQTGQASPAALSQTVMMKSSSGA